MKGGFPPFEDIWSQSVMPLAGKRVYFQDGNSMQVVEVDWDRVTRISSTGRRSHIPIEPFMWAVEQIRSSGSVTRSAIHEAFDGRFSSAVTAMHAQVPEIELRTDPLTLAARPPADKLEISGG